MRGARAGGRGSAALGRVAAIVTYLALASLYARFGLAAMAGPLARLAARGRFGYGLSSLALMAAQAIALDELLGALLGLAR